MSRSGNVWDNAAMESQLLLVAEDRTWKECLPNAGRRQG
jgi:hypothetical protein